MKSGKKGLFIGRGSLDGVKIRLKNESTIPVIAIGCYS
jgi:hypothetical protein